MNSEALRLTLADVRAAQARLRGRVRHTPILTSSTLDGRAGARLYFKCENFQSGGAFKARGATNAVFALSDAEAARGVATHSSGNHGAALARAARLRGIDAHIVMPRTAAKAKQEAVARYGARIVLCEPTLEAREQTAARVVAETQASLIHPYDDLRVMAGQATVAAELLEEVADLDLILCPVGGGGLLSGVAVAARAIRPAVRVLGVEPEGAADAQRSFQSGRIAPSIRPQSIADGLLASLGQRPFVEIRQFVDDIVTVSESHIIQAMRLIFEVLKIVVEPSAAVPYAALLGALEVTGLKVGIVLTGGNLDLERLPWSAL